MDLTKITEAEFMCEPDAYERTCRYDDAFELGEGAFQDGIGSAVWDLGDGYVICYGASPGGKSIFADDAVATHNGDLVGYYCGEGLAVAHGHSGTGRRLGPAMILVATVKRDQPDHRTVTKNGDSALRRAWRYANGKETPPWPIPSWIPHIELASEPAGGGK